MDREKNKLEEDQRKLGCHNETPDLRTPWDTKKFACVKRANPLTGACASSLVRVCVPLVCLSVSVSVSARVCAYLCVCVCARARVLVSLRLRACVRARAVRRRRGRAQARRWTGGSSSTRILSRTTRASAWSTSCTSRGARMAICTPRMGRALVICISPSRYLEDVRDTDEEYKRAVADSTPDEEEEAS